MTQRRKFMSRHSLIHSPRILLGMVPAAAVFAFAAPASAVPCDELDLPTPIFGSGGSAITPTLAKVATALAGLDDPITILYADPSACTGFSQFLGIEGAPASFKYWDADGTQQSCEPPLVGTQPIDFAHMGNPSETCAGIALPDDIGDFLAPVQTLNVITSVDSNQDSISAEALHYIFRYGADSQVVPWTVEAGLVKRTATSFVHNFLAESIGVASEGFLATIPQVTTNQASVDHIVAAAGTDPDSTLGYVSGSNADANRAVVKTLAYQHTGQECGYWPDSDANSFDKLNVRKGQYNLWTPGHFFARVDSEGEPEDPLVAELIGWFDGTVEAPGGIDVTAIIIDSGEVPGCAMQATRDGIVGAIRSYAPPQPCVCYFEEIATGSTSCETCDTTADCSEEGARCRQGFCEAY